MAVEGQVEVASRPVGAADKYGRPAGIILGQDNRDIIPAERGNCRDNKPCGLVFSVGGHQLYVRDRVPPDFKRVYGIIKSADI